MMTQRMTPARLRRTGWQLASSAGLLGLMVEPTFSQDRDGCFQPRQGCVVGASQWRNADTQVLSLTNRCGARVYVRFCVERSREQPFCGAGGIAAGSTYRTTTYGARPRGGSQWRTIGSMQSTKDWVCASRVRAWNSPMRF